MNINKKTLIEAFTKAVENMRKYHENGTYYWHLGRDENNNNWAIVLGWANGFEEDENDDYSSGTYRLCTKLAYQSNNSIMQCDYDIDWAMPYDEETGEVDDNEVPIYTDSNMEEIIDWLLECYSSYEMNFMLTG